MAYTTFETTRTNPLAAGVNHSAHLWGAIFGVIAMILLVPGILPHFFNEIVNWRPF